jgi:hypothetical protein
MSDKKTWFSVWVAQRGNRLTVIGMLLCFAVICVPVWILYPHDRLQVVLVMVVAVWFVGVAIIGGSYIAYRVEKRRAKK